MTETDVRTALADVLHRIAPEVDMSRIDPRADLREELDIDSFDFLNVLIALDERTHVTVPEADYGKVRSLDALVAYVAARAAAR